MEELAFARLLFKTVVCVMGCDGEIHDLEKKEIVNLAGRVPYFGNVDVSSELNRIAQQFSEKGRRVIKDYFNDLENADLSVYEELMILEVAFRIMYADLRLDENELRFLKMVRARLKVWDVQIVERFGKIDLLFGKQEEIKLKTPMDDYIQEIDLPDYSFLEDLDVDIVDIKDE